MNEKHLMQFPDQFRWKKPGDQCHSEDGWTFGRFIVPPRHANGRALHIIACDGDETGWEHVSVSLPEYPLKCPSWDEMCLVKRLFWEPGATVLQFHPAEDDYVNYHAGCLRLWRPVGPFPVPPSILVGPKRA